MGYESKEALLQLLKCIIDDLPINRKRYDYIIAVFENLEQSLNAEEEEDEG